MRSVLDARPEKRRIVTTRVEHPAVMGLCQHLEKKGYRVTWLGVGGDGMLDLDEPKAGLTADHAPAPGPSARGERARALSPSLCQHVEKKGYRVPWLGVDGDGMLDLDELKAALTDDTALVSIMRSEEGRVG